MQNQNQNQMPPSIKLAHKQAKQDGAREKSATFQTIEQYWDNVVNKALEVIPDDVIEVIMHKAKPAKQKLLF